ncbi:MAG: DUF6036 family nucleotidyltransferase [Acidimicrobiales bacterium]
MTFRPDAILEVLERHGVRAVLIGGLAATIHGAPTVTYDVDVIPESSRGNLDLLSAALDELDARVRVDGIPDGLRFEHDGTSLGQMSLLNLVTRFGDFDIAFHPAGISRYEDWLERSTDCEALGVHFKLASLDDIIASKQAAGRPKDHATLPLLRELRQRAGEPQL